MRWKILLGLTLVAAVFLGSRVSGADDVGGWTTFQGGPARLGVIDAPVIKTPRISWKAEVGVQSWLNNPVIVGGRVYVGSSGKSWNKPDAMDGVYCFDLNNGKRLWFTKAAADVNGVVHARGLIVATGDEGAVWALASESGEAKWRTPIEKKKVYSNPLVVAGLVVVGDSGGVLHALDLATGQAKWARTLRGSIRGGASSDGVGVFVASTGGEAACFAFDGGERWRVEVDRPGFDAPADYDPAVDGEPAEVYAAPTIAGEYVLVPFARDTYYNTPAMVALDRRTGALRWRAHDPTGLVNHFGNLRSSPAVYKDYVVYGEPYSNRMVAIGLDSGVVVWSTEIGYCTFPHYPSPAVVGGLMVLPRHDGGLYAVRVGSWEVAWSMYLADSKQAGPSFPKDMPADKKQCNWEPPAGKPIYASPAISSRGRIVVGTEEGFLYCVGD